MVLVTLVVMVEQEEQLQLMELQQGRAGGGGGVSSPSGVPLGNQRGEPGGGGAMDLLVPAPAWSCRNSKHWWWWRWWRWRTNRFRWWDGGSGIVIIRYKFQ